jgi:hypothetical protein
MRKIVYMMNFKGRRSQASSGSKLRTTSSATSCVVSTVVGTTGVETDCRASPGELAFLESESRLTGPGLFEEDGVIAFGDDSDHLLRFTTLGQGYLTAGPEPGIMAGSVVWKVDGGEGQFAQARGFISSTFTLTAAGELSDFHCGLILLPESPSNS